MANVTIKRRNTIGFEYVLETTLKWGETVITLKGTDKSITVDHDVWKIYKSWNMWQGGMMVQDAFYYLPLDAREFIMSGITPTEWVKLFNENDNVD